MSLADKLHDIPGWLNVGAGMIIGPGIEYGINNPHQLKNPTIDASIGAGLMGGLSDNPGYSALGLFVINLLNGNLLNIAGDFIRDGRNFNYIYDLEKFVPSLACFGGAYILGRLVGGKRD